MNLNIDILGIICEHLDAFDQTCLSCTCRLYIKELGIHGNDARWSSKLRVLIQAYPELQEIVQSDLIEFNLYNTPMFIKTLYQYHLYTFKVMNNKSVLYDYDYNLEMVDSFTGALINCELDKDVIHFKQVMHDKYNSQRKNVIDKNIYIEKIYATPLKNIFTTRNKIKLRKQRSIDYKYNKPFMVIQTLVSILLQHTIYRPNNNNIYRRFSYNQIRDRLLKEHKVRGFKNMINDYGCLFIDEEHLIQTNQLEAVALLIYSTGNNQNYSFDRVGHSKYRLRFTRAHTNEGGWCIWV